MPLRDLARFCGNCEHWRCVLMSQDTGWCHVDEKDNPVSTLRYAICPDWTAKLVVSSNMPKEPTRSWEKITRVLIEAHDEHFSDVPAALIEPSPLRPIVDGGERCFRWSARIAYLTESGELRHLDLGGSFPAGVTTTGLGSMIMLIMFNLRSMYDDDSEKQTSLTMPGLES